MSIIRYVIGLAFEYRYIYIYIRRINAFRTPGEVSLEMLVSIRSKNLLTSEKIFYNQIKIAKASRNNVSQTIGFCTRTRIARAREANRCVSQDDILYVGDNDMVFYRNGRGSSVTPWFCKCSLYTSQPLKLPRISPGSTLLVLVHQILCPLVV